MMKMTARRLSGARCIALACACAGLLLASACRKDEDAPARQTISRPIGPPRIISFAPSSTEIIAELGCVERLVGVGDFCQYPAEVTRLPRVGGLFDPNLELIMELAPDLVVMRGSNQSVMKMCADRGIDIYNDPTERLDDVFVAIDELGERLDRAGAADALKSRIRGELDAVRNAVRGAPRPGVLFVVGRRAGEVPAGVTTAGPGTFIDDLIRITGGENVFGSLDAEYPDVSLEAIVAAAPDVIIEAQPEAEASAELTQRVMDVWRRLRSLPAVETNRIYVITDDNVLIPSPRMTETARRLAGLLHPEIDIE